MDKRKSYTSEQISEIKKLYNDGYSTCKIAELYGKTASAIAGVLKRNGCDLRSNKINSRRYYFNENFFENINNEYKAYWLGFMYADGYVHTNSNRFGLSIAIKDINHLEKFKKCLEANYEIKVYNQNSGYSNNSIYCKLLFTSEKAKNDLIKNGCFTQKTDIIKAPNISKKLYKDFIRGYLDGDGCITKSLNKYSKYDWKIKICGTVELLNFIKEYIEENEVAHINTFYKRQEHQTVSSIDFGGNNQVEKFLNLIYKDAKIYLDRKYNLYIDFCNYKKQSSLSGMIGVKSLE